MQIKFIIYQRISAGMAKRCMNHTLLYETLFKLNYAYLSMLNYNPLGIIHRHSKNNNSYKLLIHVIILQYHFMAYLVSDMSSN